MSSSQKVFSITRGAFSLKTKITVLVVFLILAILLSIGYLQIERDRKLHTEFQRERAVTLGQTILSFNVLSVRRATVRQMQSFLDNFIDQEDLAQDIVFISLQDRSADIIAGAVNRKLVTSYRVEEIVDGEPIVETRPIETTEEEIEFIEKLQQNRISEINNNLSKYSVTQSSDDTNASANDVHSVMIGYSQRTLKQKIYYAILVNMSIFSVYIVIGVLASVFLGGAISKPIKVLEEAMKRVSAGDLNQRLEINSKDEIGTLAATFNYMTEGLREKEKIKREFLVAREVQFNLLPRKTLTHEHLDVATYFEPATEVGGDYYDFVQIDEDSLGIIIADVSGHGMSAGLMMAITKSCLHTQLSFQSDPDALLASMNDILFELSEARSMVTMFFSALNMRDHSICFASAGHPFTYLIDGEKRELTSLETISYPLAVRKGLNLKTQTVRFKSGDYLVYYSDGIVEALNEDGDVFGFERMEEILQNADYSNARELLEALITEVRIHIGTAEQFDDITAVVVRIK